jgi:hypothetical protein
MKAAKTLKAVLDGLGFPVCRMFYKAADSALIPDTYIVFQITGAEPFYADDYAGIFNFTFQVTIASRVDYTDLLTNVLDALRVDGITITSIGAEYTDAELDYAYIPITVIVMEE